MAYGVVIAFGASWAISFINVVVRRIKEVHFTVIFSYTNVIMMVVAFFVALGDHALHEERGKFLIYKNNRAYLWSLIGGFSELFFLVFQTIALQNAPGLFIALLNY